MRKPFLEMKKADIQKMSDADLVAGFAFAQEAIKVFKQNEYVLLVLPHWNHILARLEIEYCVLTVNLVCMYVGSTRMVNVASWHSRVPQVPVGARQIALSPLPGSSPYADCPRVLLRSSITTRFTSVRP